jgi:hypothetical protein
MNASRINHPLHRFAMSIATCSLLFLTGCSEDVHSTYGHRQSYAGTSLNGTRVLGGMFEAAGHTVRSWSYLSPRLDNADVLVWFPNDFEAPTEQVEDWLTQWLMEGDPANPRVLVYVGRDFDAAPDYWQSMQGKAPPNLTKEYARRLREAKLDERQYRPSMLSHPETQDWFELDNKPPRDVQVKKLKGPWAKGVDASKTDIVRNTRLIPYDDTLKPLLADGNDDLIASETEYPGYYGNSTAGRLVMIENGSWLLNARLVNHEHRKLAGKLVESIGPGPRTVYFLESAGDGPPIRNEDPTVQNPTGLALFRVWPIGAVLTQLAALGIVFALLKWPIFGIPKRIARASTTDFNSHVAALGRLLAGGKNRAYAIGLLLLYRQSLRREPTIEIVTTNTPLPPPNPTDTA